MSEAAILSVVRKNFPDHLILGEEGGVIGDSSSDYLWCIDPLGMWFTCLLASRKSYLSEVSTHFFEFEN